MAKVNLLEIKGFDELNRKLKQLPDAVKRKEVLAIYRKIAQPVRKKYESNLPIRKGTLSKSVAVKTISVRKSGGNPEVRVVPGRRGKNDAYYLHMVIEKGTRTGSNKRGSRKGKNTVVEAARNRTLGQIKNNVLKESLDKVTALIQKKINNLSI